MFSGLMSAVHHALAVRVVERGRHLPRETKRFLHGELPLALQAPPQRFPGDVGHHVVEQAAGFARIDQTQDVRVLEIGGDFDLGEEALSAEHGGQLGVQHLDGDLAAVLQVFGEIHRGHAALSHLAVEAVAVGQGLREVHFRARAFISAVQFCTTISSFRSLGAVSLRKRNRLSSGLTS